MRRAFLLISLLASLLPVQVNARVKVACIGDSVTYGTGIKDRESDSYPVQLGRMLGDEYEVRNFGRPGATLLASGHRPYTSLEECAQALAFVPDLVIIHLGLNDTDPRDWPDHSDDFIGDYRNLISSFRKVNPKAEIWICQMSPIFSGHPRFLSGTRDWHSQIQSEIAQIARTDDVGLIDLYDALIDRPDLFPDNVHPTAEGAGIIAQVVCSAITGNYGGLQMSPLYSDDMVLQCGKNLSIRGISDADEQITVELLRSSSKKVRNNGSKQEKVVSESAKTQADGKWQVTFPALPEGGPYELRVSNAKKSLVFGNVWLGEVWICTGQSNMAFPLKNCSTAVDDLKEADNKPLLHLFSMKENWLTNNVSWTGTALDSVNRLQCFSPSGWEKCSASAAEFFSAVGYHFGRALSDSLGCHIGLICCSVGGSTTESWTDADALRRDFPEILDDWYNGDFGQAWARERAKKNIQNRTNPLQRHPYQPGYLFSAGIKSLDRYCIRGIVWYQGESNAHNIEAHDRLFHLMVNSWRGWWGELLPVQMVQLSGIGTRPSWPKFRNSQRCLSEEIDGVGMTVCSDLGDSIDVHPRNKKPVGERVAASALHYVYDRPDVVPSGPVYRSFDSEGNSLRLHFRFTEGMRAGKGFEVAGADGLYYPAAIRMEGSTISVSSPKVPAPRAVRYAWKPNPADADLTNKTGMPCSTFKDERY